MKKLEIIALCAFADYSKNGAFNITGIFDQIKTKSLPTSLTAFVVFTITGLKPNTSPLVKLKIADPNKKEILNQDLKLLVGKNGKANYKFQIVGLPLSEYGLYKVSICDDKNKLGDTTFEVF